MRERRCIGCGKTVGKACLVRIVRRPDGTAAFDPTGRAPGRGAYVCSQACLAEAVKKNKLARALKVTLGSDEMERIAVDVASALAVREGKGVV
ncbi:DUF448 domain-containing protein [Eggerthellaceae bacterium zg-887]|uniref:RNase P modulator RnpM n=1 Tax=Xiamenia xianingshaonis TaxID=2682776 RepID=UPI00140D1940|nr:YlxR family protein [Xiamenia xianingshaonis]NHM16102.1 DUF448 domain-containing protein [Xiamenia xianingshaonis]